MLKNRGLYGRSRSASLSGTPVVSPFDVNNFPNFPSKDTGGVYPYVVNLVTQGDSLTAGQTQSPQGPAEWLPFVLMMLGTQVKVTDVSFGGQTLANMVTTGPAAVDTLLVRTPGVINVTTYQGGINDLVINQAFPGNATAASIAADYFAYADARIAAGWDFVIPISVEASTIWNNATYGNIDYNTCAALISASILSHSKSQYVNIPADPILGPLSSATNIAYYLDGTHKTVNGDSRKARELIYPIIQSILAPTDLGTGNAIFGCWPPNGPIGGTTAVGVRVTNLPPMAGHTITVTIGGQVCTAITWEPTLNTVFCTVPSGNSTGNVVVTVDGTGARGGTGLWTALNVPIITVEPNIILAAGGPVTIHADPAGATFSGGMIPTVLDPVLGLVNCTSVVVVSPTIMTCVVPALTPTVASAVPVDIEVNGSLDTPLTKLGIAASDVAWLLTVCADLYTLPGGTATLADVTKTGTLVQPTAGKQPTYKTTTFASGITGVQPSLSFNAASSQDIASNVFPPVSPAAPYSIMAVMKIAPWTTNAHYFSGTGTQQWQWYASTVYRFSDAANNGPENSAAPTSTGYPGNFFAFITDGASSDILVDGISVKTNIVGIPAGVWGPGLAWGTGGGSFGSVDIMFMCGTHDHPSASSQATMRWLGQYFGGTP